MMRRTSSRRWPCSAWKMALCSLSSGKRLTPAAPRRRPHQLAGDHQHFLVRQRDVLARLDRRQRRHQPERTDQRGDHELGLRSGRHPRDAPRHRRRSRPRNSGHPRAQAPRHSASSAVATTRGLKAPHLLGQPLDVAAGRQRRRRGSAPESARPDRASSRRSSRSIRGSRGASRPWRSPSYHGLTEVEPALRPIKRAV